MPTPSPIRLAIVQHGDYRAALRIIAAGEVEPYFGMRYSVKSLQALIDGQSHLVISLDAPRYHENHGRSALVGFPSSKRLPFLPGSGTVAHTFLMRAIIRELHAFRPTHLLLRTAGPTALKLLQWSAPQQLPTLMLFANSFLSPKVKTQKLNRQLARWCNLPHVYLVGNHRDISTQSMIESGVDPHKAVAYDWPGARNPNDYPAKSLHTGPGSSNPCHVVFAATMVAAKGIGDLIHALALLRQQSFPVRLTAFGEGPELEAMKALAAQLLPNAAQFPGRVDNNTLFAALQNSTLSCVPSRPEWQEGGSLVLTEALASRTPGIISDQPMFTRTFKDHEGVRFFHAADPASLANTIREAASDPATYAALSQSTAQAFLRTQCPTTLADLLERWKSTFNVPSAASAGELN